MMTVSPLDDDDDDEEEDEDEDKEDEEAAAACAVLSTSLAIEYKGSLLLVVPVGERDRR